MAVGVVGALVVGGGCIDAVKFTPLPGVDPATPTVPQPRLPQNDAYEGSVVAGKLTPRFVWEASTVEVGEVRYELQYSADPTFNTGVRSAQTIQTNYQPELPLAVSSVPPVGRRYFWRVRACAAALCSEYSRSWWVNVGRSLKDFNGDGYADVIVSSHISSDEVGLPGRAYVYMGGPGNTFDGQSDAVLTDAAVESWFGYSVASAGDFNGDGYADVLVGAPKSDNAGNEGGRAYLFFGGPGDTLDTAADVTFEGIRTGSWLGGSVSGAGDVNGDGFSDVIIGALDETGTAGVGRAYLYLGSSRPAPLARNSGALAGGPTSISYGATVAGAGDINGDGYADVLVNSSSYLHYDPAEICRADIYWGGEGNQFDYEVDDRVTGASGEKCSLKAAPAGDVNGDGFSDVIARISRRAEGGRLFLGGKKFSGIADAVLNVQAGHTCREAFGVGDVNGDGADDIAMTDNVSSTSGQVLVHFGKLGAQSAALLESPSGVLSKTSTYTLFGWVVRAAGDVNGDSLDDLVLGDQGEGEANGSFYVYLGNGGEVLNNFPDGIVTGGGPRRFLGFSVAMSFVPVGRRTVP